MQRHTLWEHSRGRAVALVVGDDLAALLLPDADAAVGSAKVDADRQLAHLHRTTPARKQWDELSVMAFDHRSQFYDMARIAGVGEERISALKNLLVRSFEQVHQSRQLQGRGGLLVDGGDYGMQALASATGRG